MQLKLVDMESAVVLKNFFHEIKDDSRIGPVHIAMFMALYQWYEKTNEHPLYFFARDVKPLAKFSSGATFHKSMKDLHDFGYIVYTPSYNPYLGSMVEFKNL